MFYLFRQMIFLRRQAGNWSGEFQNAKTGYRDSLQPVRSGQVLFAVSMPNINSPMIRSDVTTMMISMVRSET